jgi:transcriptional regulator with XRE-family HTH domain
MRTPADRLREAREVAGFTGATEVAENFGWNKNTYKSHENGIRGISAKKARQYARGLRTTPEWILYERGPGPLNRVQKETIKDRILPDEETLELSIRQALRFAASRDPPWIAKATMVLYKLLSERKRRGEPINDETTSKAMLEALMRDPGEEEPPDSEAQRRPPET